MQQSATDIHPTQRFLDVAATGTEALLGGIAAGYTGLATKNIAGKNDDENFAASLTLSALAGGAIFSILGTAYRGINLYLEAKKSNPALEPKDFFSADNNIDLAKFGVTLFSVGATAFGGFTSCAQGLAHKLGEFPADLVGIAVGWSVFAVGNQFPTLKLPWPKLLEIALVLIGFSAGSTVVTSLIASKLVGEAIADYVVKPLVAPAIAGAVTVAAKSAFRLSQYACSFFCAPKTNNETSPLLRDVDTKANDRTDTPKN